MKTIGWFNYEDDELVLAKAHDAEEQYRQRMKSNTVSVGNSLSSPPTSITTRLLSNFNANTLTSSDHATTEWESDYVYAGWNTIRRVLGQGVFRPPEQPDPTAQIVPTLPSNRGTARPQMVTRATYSTEQLMEVDDVCSG